MHWHLLFLIFSPSFVFRLTPCASPAKDVAGRHRGARKAANGTSAEVGS